MISCWCQYEDVPLSIINKSLSFVGKTETKKTVWVVRGIVELTFWRQYALVKISVPENIAIGAS